MTFHLEDMVARHVAALNEIVSRDGDDWDACGQLIAAMESFMADLDDEMQEISASR